MNYYSQFTSVGYISPNAKIGGTLFSDIVLDMNDDTGSISGCMFADYIYRCAEDEENISSTTDSDGATHYLLTDIDPETGKWNGTINNLYFKYGSFNFVMSSAADTVSSIWSDSGELKLLNKQGYTINGSVLYCKDEYRYSEGIDDGGSLLPGIASANETKYAGISTAVNNSNLLDQGKYVICAKVPKVNNPSSASDYYYYALKIVAEIDSSTGTISYVFDNSSKCDITDYILDTSGEETIYSSAMWEVEEDSETPKFVNCRFSGQYLTKSVDNDEYDVALTSDSNNASEFMVNVSNHTFGFSVTSGDTYYQYYLNYRNNGTSESPDHEFYFSTVNNASIEIDVYLISNGFNLQLVTSTSDIVRSGDYIIVGKNGTNCYLLGVEIEDDVVVNEFANDYYWVNFDPSETVTLSFYQSIKNYIWHTNTLSGVGSASFRDKMSGTYFLTNSNGTLSLNTTESYFTYNEGTSAEGGDLYNGTGYLSFSYEEGDCGFSLGSSNYNIYLYQLIPDDNDPPYITYDGATYVDATSTPIDAGNYLILAHLNNNYYAVANNSGTISYSAGTMVSNLFTPSEGSIAYANCEWTVSTSSSTPTFVNNNYYITISGSSNPTSGNPVNASLSTTSKNWMYDASSYRVYYEVQTGTQTIDGEVIPVYSKYYLVWDTTNSVFKVTLDTDINTYCYDIELYESTYMYTYTGLTELTATSNNDATNGLSTTQTTENTSVGYIILTNQLQETWTNDSYAVGITGTGTSVSNYSVKTYNISDVIPENPPAFTTFGLTINVLFFANFLA